MCGVCLEESKCDSQIACCHTYCLQCILQWSQVSNTCPLCKAKFNEVVERDGTKHVVHDKVQAVHDNEEDDYSDYASDASSDVGITFIKKKNITQRKRKSK